MQPSGDTSDTGASQSLSTEWKDANTCAKVQDVWIYWDALNSHSTWMWNCLSWDTKVVWFNLRSVIRLKLQEKMASFQNHIFLSSFCPSLAALSLFLLLLWSSWFLPVKMRWFKTKTGPCVTSDVRLLIKLITMQQGHTDILPPPISRTSAVVCFLLLTVASRVYTGKFPKNFDKV